MRLKPSDIQPDIFSYLLHLMYTGKMAPQLIDPVRLEQGIKFLHAYPLLQEATLASQGAFAHQDPVFPLASSLYGIQIAEHQLRPAAKPTSGPGPDRAAREGRPPGPRPGQEPGPEPAPPSQPPQPPPQQLPPHLAAAGRTPLPPSDPPPAPLSPELVPTPGPAPPPPPGLGLGLADEAVPEPASPGAEPPAALSIAHVKPSILKRNGSFPKHYACHLCGRRFALRASLREHLQIHTGVALGAPPAPPHPQAQPGADGRAPLTVPVPMPLPVPVAVPMALALALGRGAAEDAARDALEGPEAGPASDGELPRACDSPSPLLDGQPPSETPPPSDIADIDNLEQADQEREVKRRKYECGICGRKFIQKSHWREHMYIHTGKPFRCSTCDKSFCRANQAARHVCLNQSVDTYTVVDKQTLELCTFEEGSQMDSLLLHPSKPYKCNLCDKTFASPGDVVRHACHGQAPDAFALDEGRALLLGAGDSEATEPDHPVLASIKKEQETVLLD